MNEFLCSLRLGRFVNTIRHRYAAIRTIIGQSGCKESAKHCLWMSKIKGKGAVLAENENIDVMNFSLVRGGVITGKVTDAL